MANVQQNDLYRRGYAHGYENRPYRADWAKESKSYVTGFWDGQADAHAGLKNQLKFTVLGDPIRKRRARTHKMRMRRA